jgi:hypothetical protein
MSHATLRRAGQPRGPWQGTHLLYLGDPETMNRLSYPTSTVGGIICIRELRDKICWMRRLKRSSDIYPVVRFAKKWMNTRFGGRNRPHFEIVRWVRLGGEGGEVEALPSPTAPTSPATAVAKPENMPLTEVKEPTLAEEMDDAIPDFSESEAAKPAATKSKTANEPQKAPAPRPTARRDLKKQSSPAKTAARSTTRRRLTNFDAG